MFASLLHNAPDTSLQCLLFRKSNTPSSRPGERSTNTTCLTENRLGLLKRLFCSSKMTVHRERLIHGHSLPPLPCLQWSAAAMRLLTPAVAALCAALTLSSCHVPLLPVLPVAILSLRAPLSAPLLLLPLSNFDNDPTCSFPHRSRVLVSHPAYRSTL
jgi:hypothetical protein